MEYGWLMTGGCFQFYFGWDKVQGLNADISMLKILILAEIQIIYKN